MSGYGSNENAENAAEACRFAQNRAEWELTKPRLVVFATVAMALVVVLVAWIGLVKPLIDLLKPQTELNGMDRGL